MVSISIIIPAYNEEKAIKDTIDNIKKAIKNIKNKIDIIVVDDCSKDKTAEILSKIKAIKLIRHSINKGYGASLKTAIKNTASDCILIIDGDGTYPASSIPLLINYSKKCDMVVGTRTGRIVKIPFLRRPRRLVYSGK